MILRFFVKDEGLTVKTFLQKQKLPRSYLTHLGDTQYIVNNQSVANYYQLHKGDILEVVIPVDKEAQNVHPVKAPLNIVYEDSYLLILNKEANLASIPTHEHYQKSLADHVLAYYKEKGILSSLHFVNRLDAPTSGLIILAKNGYVMSQMKKTNITKKYLLVTEGILEKKEDRIDAKIKRLSPTCILRTVAEDGVEASTIYRVLETANNQSLVEATLLTGRTHQLRVHFASINHPIVGDHLYGHAEKGEQLLLHSYYVSFIHPITKQDITLTIYPNWVQCHYFHALYGR